MYFETFSKPFHIIKEKQKEIDKEVLQAMKVNKYFLFEKSGRKYLQIKKWENKNTIWGKLLQSSKEIRELEKNAGVFLTGCAAFLILSWDSLFFVIFSLPKSA